MKIFDQEFKGLSQNEVLKRIQDGKTHFVESKTTKTDKWIFKWRIALYKAILKEGILDEMVYKNMQK